MFPWEVAEGAASDVVRKNVAVLAAPDFSFESTANASRLALCMSWFRAYRRDLEQRITDRANSTIQVGDLHDRFRTILQMFKLFGYNDYYAGHEGGIRLRLLEMLAAEGHVASDSTIVLYGRTNLVAAYYLAFTDYWLNSVPVALSAIPRKDIRVFISHSSSDKVTARKLCDALQREGVRVWLDERELQVGDSLWEDIGRGIEESDYLLLLISTRSVSSQWVRREVNAALATELDAARKIVLPVLIESTEMPVFLRERLYCDLAADFDEGVVTLLRAMV